MGFCWMYGLKIPNIINNYGYYPIDYCKIAKSYYKFYDIANNNINFI